MVPYEPAVRVPLILTPPGGSDHRVVHGLVEHLDVAATIRDIAGAGGHPTFEGRSLLGWANSGEGVSRVAVFSESFGFGMVRTSSHKLVFGEETHGPVQLFDLDDDPHEDTNLLLTGNSAHLCDRLMKDVVWPFLALGPVRLGSPSFGQRLRI